MLPLILFVCTMVLFSNTFQILKFENFFLSIKNLKVLALPPDRDPCEH